MQKELERTRRANPRELVKMEPEIPPTLTDQLSRSRSIDLMRNSTTNWGC